MAVLPFQGLPVKIANNYDPVKVVLKDVQYQTVVYLK